jgi:hypothetical protein
VARIGGALKAHLGQTKLATDSAIVQRSAKRGGWQSQECLLLRLTAVKVGKLQKDLYMRIILALVLGITAASAVTAQTSVSIGINQPGVYGRINIGELPRPALYRAEPVIIVPSRVVVERRPVYLYVPPTHEQNWRRYCGQYGACGQPVHFVRDEWVRERYEQEHPGWNRGRHRGWDKHHGHRDEHRGDGEREHDNGRKVKHGRD